MQGYSLRVKPTLHGSDAQTNVCPLKRSARLSWNKTTKCWQSLFKRSPHISNFSKRSIRVKAVQSNSENPWVHGGFPQYLQSELDLDDSFCDSYRNASSTTHVQEYLLSPDSSKDVYDPNTPDFDPIWDAIRAEAQAEATSEPVLTSFLYSCVLSHSCLEQAVGFVVGQRLANRILSATQWLNIFADGCFNQDAFKISVREDLKAIRTRDPACRSYCHALLHYTGFHALQAHRAANYMWSHDKRVLAYALQSRMSEVYGADIHPAATIGKGVFIDHCTGVVIGETAVVGDRVSIMQGVTLGGTGKNIGDRHPKVGQGVLLSAGASVLGNIRVGKGSMIAAGSLVLKPVKPHKIMAGNPAKEVGQTFGSVPALSMKQEVKQTFCDEWEAAVAASVKKREMSPK